MVVDLQEIKSVAHRNDLFIERLRTAVEIYDKNGWTPGVEDNVKSAVEMTRIKPLLAYNWGLVWEFSI